MVSAVIKRFKPSRRTDDSLWDEIGLPSRGEALYRVVRDGLRYSTFCQIAVLAGTDSKLLAEILDISPTTAHRRAKAGRFSPHESDRIIRFAQVLAAAVKLFEGDRAQARSWMQAPVKGLGNKAPVDMLATSVEAEAVLDLIGRLEHGIVA